MSAYVLTRPWKITWLLVSSGCAGSLDDADDYYQTVPVRAPEAGRTSEGSGPVGGWGGAGTPAPAAGRVWGGASGAALGASEAGRQAAAPSADEDAGVPDAGAGLKAAPACDFRALMQAKCGNASCHGAPASATGLDLTSAMLAARVQGRTGQGACSDKLLIDPQSPADSKLYLKVSGSSCGSQMPLGGQLSSDEQACVLNWIEQL